MRKLMLVGVILLALCACDKQATEGTVRVIELASGKYSVQVYSLGDWKWISRDGRDWYGVNNAIKNGGMLTFPNEDAACDHKEKMELLTSINRVVKCE